MSSPSRQEHLILKLQQKFRNQNQAVMNRIKSSNKAACYNLFTFWKLLKKNISIHKILNAISQQELL